jgi:hypothetical protein
LKKNAMGMLEQADHTAQGHAETISFITNGANCYTTLHPNTTLWLYEVIHKASVISSPIFY